MESPRMGTKARRMCTSCGETTTHKFGRLDEDEEARWLCYMHDLNPKSPRQLARIQATRVKPWEQRGRSNVEE